MEWISLALFNKWGHPTFTQLKQQSIIREIIQRNSFPVSKVKFIVIIVGVFIDEIELNRANSIELIQ